MISFNRDGRNFFKTTETTDFSLKEEASFFVWDLAGAAQTSLFNGNDYAYVQEGRFQESLFVAHPA